MYEKNHRLPNPARLADLNLSLRSLVFSHINKVFLIFQAILVHRTTAKLWQNCDKNKDHKPSQALSSLEDDIQQVHIENHFLFE